MGRHDLFPEISPFAARITTRERRWKDVGRTRGRRGRMQTGRGRMQAGCRPPHQHTAHTDKKRARHPHCCGCRANTWRRPTLTGPVVPIPSALQRFTSGFGMGPGGSTALWPPEGDPGHRLLDSGPGLWLSETPWLQRIAVFGCCQRAPCPLPDIHTENPSFFNLNSSTEPNAVT
jgi:hypothetical protein